MDAKSAYGKGTTIPGDAGGLQSSTGVLQPLHGKCAAWPDHCTANQQSGQRVFSASSKAREPPSWRMVHAKPDTVAYSGVVLTQAGPPALNMRHPLGAPPPVRELDGLPPPALNYPPAPSTKSRKASVSGVPYAFPMARAGSGLAPAYSSGSDSFRHSSDFPAAPAYPAPPPPNVPYPARS